MRVILLLLISMLTLGLSACGPIYKTTYSYQPPHSNMGRMCTTQCLQNQNSCQSMCEMRKQTCLIQTRQDAHDRYEEYKHRREREHKSVDKTPGDFQHSWDCDQDCGCDGAFNVCYQTCGGIVTPHQECVAFCDKK
jgi:hypothetical protein